jgi:hypothetical protein
MADVPLLPASRLHRLATISHPHTRASGFSWYSLQLLAPGVNSPTATSRLSPFTGSQLNSKGNWSSLYSLGTSRTENTASTVLLLLHVQLLLQSSDGYWPFPSNGHLFWFHNSCFKQISHNIKNLIPFLLLFLFLENNICQMSSVKQDALP